MERQAVKENRMISQQEAFVRQVLGCITLALTSGWLFYKVQHRLWYAHKRSPKQSQNSVFFTFLGANGNVRSSTVVLYRVGKHLSFEWPVQPVWMCFEANLLNLMTTGSSFAFPAKCNVSFVTILLPTSFTLYCCRLRWAVQSGQLFKDRSFTPPEHLHFIRGKRRGILANFAASNLISVGFGTAVYILAGIMSQQRFNALLMGSLCHICIMVFFSLRS